MNIFVWVDELCQKLTSSCVVTVFIATMNWQASKVSETLSGVYKFKLVRYIYIYICVYIFIYYIAA